MANRTDEQLASIMTRSTKQHQVEVARKWGIPANVAAGATFGLGVTMMFESGYREEQLVEIVRELVADLAEPPRVVGDLIMPPGGRGTS